LNITSDHVNYHGSFAEYRRIKARIFANQAGKDFAILNAEDDEQKKIEGNIRARVAGFSSKHILPSGIFVSEGNIVLNLPGMKEEKYPLSMINIPGLHNVENVMAVDFSGSFLRM